MSCAGSQALPWQHCCVVSGCLSLQGVASRRYRRPLSPSGSRRQYHVPTSSPIWNSLFLPLELVRLMVLLRFFFSRRTSLSTRCWRRVRGAGIPPLRGTTWGMALPPAPLTSAQGHAKNDSWTVMLGPEGRGGGGWCLPPHPANYRAGS